MRSLLAIFCALLLLPAAARAQETNAPPGNSGLEQYLETVPGPTGDKVPARTRKRSALSTSERDALAAEGADGRALAKAVERTASARAARRVKPVATKGGRNAAAKPEPGPADAESKASVRDTLVATQDGRMGAALPVIAGSTLLAVLVAMILRRRDSTEEDAGA